MFVLIPISLLRYVSITYVLFDERDFFFFSLSFFFRKVDRFVVHIVEAFIGISTNIAKTKMRFLTRIASFVSNGKEIRGVDSISPRFDYFPAANIDAGVTSISAATDHLKKTICEAGRKGLMEHKIVVEVILSRAPVLCGRDNNYPTTTVVCRVIWPKEKRGTEH
jgi:hypothetical protein